MVDFRTFGYCCIRLSIHPAIGSENPRWEKAAISSIRNASGSGGSSRVQKYWTMTTTRTTKTHNHTQRPTHAPLFPFLKKEDFFYTSRHSVTPSISFVFSNNLPSTIMKRRRVNTKESGQNKLSLAVMLGDIYMLHLGNGRDVASSTAEKERERKGMLRGVVQSLHYKSSSS